MNKFLLALLSLSLMLFHAQAVYAQATDEYIEIDETESSYSASQPVASSYSA